MNPIHAVFALLLAVSSGASAMNRCVDAQGKVSYSDRPCASDDQQSRVRIVEPSGFRPEKQSTLRASTLQAAPVDRAGAGAGGGAIMLTDARRVACEDAKRAYHFLPSRVPPRTTLAQMASTRKAAEVACQKPILMSEDEFKMVANEAALREARAMADAASDEPSRARNENSAVVCNAGRCTDQRGSDFRPVNGLSGVLEGANGRRCNMRPGGLVCD